MKTVCLYFQVHQPYRLNEFSFFSNSDEQKYFNGPRNFENKTIFEKVAKKCYLPTTKILLKLLKKHPEFRVSFSLSGVFLEQCLEFGNIGQKVLQNFQKLAESNRVEFLSETYHHSLAFLYSKYEFAEQIKLHRKITKKLFNKKPKIFRNTELIYNNKLATFIEEMGFKGILAEGWDHVLKEKNPHHVMDITKEKIHSEDKRIANKFQISKIKKGAFGILLKNYHLSDDIAFRFGDKSWNEYPLTTKKFANWVDNIYGETINLFMDFETFGEHQWEDSGIFNFLYHLPEELLKKNISFKTPSETLESYPHRDKFDCPHYLSWADMERNLSAWLDNDLQKSALNEISGIEKATHPLKKSRKKKVKKIIQDFRKLQTSDHFYYMSTKYWNDGDVHTYFSPFESPYEAYINYMNVTQNLKKRIKAIL